MRPQSALLAALALLSTPLALHATTQELNFSAPGIYTDLYLTYGSTTDARYTQGLAVTGASGHFSDAALGINTTITGVQPLSLAGHDPTNLLTPADFSKFPVASGLPPESNGAISYDNLFFPTGSPQTASDYPFAGGDFSIYGLLLDLGNNEILNLWSNGAPLGSGLSPDYGVAVVTSAQSLGYTAGGVLPSPEPASLALLGTGVAAGLSLLRRRL